MTEQQFRDKHKGKCSYVNREKELDELVADAYSLVSNDCKSLVSGQSEQLVCDCGNSSMTWYGDDDDKKYFCFNCKKEAN